VWIINGLLRCALLVAVFAAMTACGSIGPRPSIPASDLYKVVRDAPGQ